jgi:hypothetical protein
MSYRGRGRPAGRVCTRVKRRGGIAPVPPSPADNITAFRDDSINICQVIGCRGDAAPLNKVFDTDQCLKTLTRLVENDVLIFDWLDILACFEPILNANVSGP